MKKRSTSRYRHPMLYYQPQPKAREARPKKKRCWRALLLIGFGLALCWFFFLSPFFYIKRIYIQGNAVLTKEDIQKYLDISPKQNIFLFRSSSIEKKLQKGFPLLASVQVRKHVFINPTVILSIKEKQPFALWRFQDKVFALDEKAVVSMEYPYPFSEQTLVVVSYPIDEITIGESVCDPRLLDYSQKLAPKVKDIMHRDIKQIEALDTRDFQFVLDNNVMIKFTVDKDLLTSLAKLQTVYDRLENESTAIEYIDLRAEKVYIK